MESGIGEKKSVTILVRDGIMKKKSKISQSRKSRTKVCAWDTGVAIVIPGRNPVDRLAYLIFEGRVCEPPQITQAFGIG